MSSSRVTKPARLIGSVHRLFNRSGQQLTEPMLHPTPHEFLYEQWEKEHGQDADLQPNKEELGDLPLNLSFHKFDADEGPPRFSVIEEYLALQKVEKVMDSLRNAGAEFTVEGFKKLERDLRFKGTIWDKIIEEHNLHGARTAWIGIAPDIFYNALGDRDCVFGAARDRDVYPETLLQNWKQNGFAISFNKFQSDLVTNDALFGPELGKKVTDYEADLLQRHRATLKANHGGVVLGFLFFFMGIYTLWWQWQFINYRDLERQRFKMAWRIQDADAPLTEAKKNMRQKHKEFLLTYFDDDDEEEEEEEEEEDDE